ncbi:molybdopterin-dependent oxidoreductase-like protein [Streptomyces sp. Amel2xB2]|uniref:molybdopterin-dependent oxidoreductase n=1 Tax=Streptomyces sp. Amel2xB2 TaxID=1305829 RepID=UPI000DB96B1D|nr:molybdopterin-dependent oxidoreductase [Streptomyces sp. Amel2xB2]RAJ59103.1 molybdopterin-dependent oxidoreductase-like protein [Streptomyces sp. Amel2xB2]
MNGLSSPRRTAAPPAGSFALSGDLAEPSRLTVADLRERFEQHEAEVVFHCATNGPQRHTFSGPLLREVITGARPLFDPRRRKDRSRFMVSVTGGDGHHTVLSWGEIDSDFCDAPVLLATGMDGRDLDLAGSQLVAPWDRCGARYVSAISSVWVGAPLPFPADGPEPLVRVGARAGSGGGSAGPDRRTAG